MMTVGTKVRFRANLTAFVDAECIRARKDMTAQAGSEGYVYGPAPTPKLDELGWLVVKAESPNEIPAYVLATPDLLLEI